MKKRRKTNQQTFGKVEQPDVRHRGPEANRIKFPNSGSGDLSQHHGMLAYLWILIRRRFLG